MRAEHVTPLVYVLPFAASVAITCLLAIVVWRRRGRIPPARDFAFWLAAQAGWAAAYVIELRAPYVGSKLFWDYVQWLFSAPLLASKPRAVHRTALLSSERSFDVLITRVDARAQRHGGRRAGAARVSGARGDRDVG